MLYSCCGVRIWIYLTVWNTTKSDNETSKLNVEWCKTWFGNPVLELLPEEYVKVVLN
jgi:hypothetical protein